MPVQSSEAELDGFLRFLDRTPTPYHVAHELSALLDANGFEKLAEHEDWSLDAGKSYYVERNGKAVVAWRMGNDRSQHANVRIMGAHTDSPGLKLRDETDYGAAGCCMCTVDPYGSPLAYTWLDRGLGVAGVLFHKVDGGNGVKRTMVRHDDPVFTIPSLAIHLDEALKTNGLKLKPQDHLNCIVSSENKGKQASIVGTIASLSGIAADDVLENELYLFDVQPAQRTGANGEFISSGRLDNLFSSYCSVAALLRAAKKKPQHTLVAALFDTEEIGSYDRAGAASDFLKNLVSRMAGGGEHGNGQSAYGWQSQSVLVSVDMAHARHPNFADKADKFYTPELNKGLAVKYSSRGNYAMSRELLARVKNACAMVDIPLQKFSYRPDSPGGRSIGPLVETSTGVQTVDVGAGLLSMHSIRETCGAQDVKHTIDALEAIYLMP